VWSLDPTTERLIRTSMAEQGLSFKVALNEAIRRGLADLADDGDEPFVVRATSLGLRAGIDAARLNHLADELEAEAFVELEQRAAE